MRLLILLLSTTWRLPVEADQRPNIVFLFAEELGAGKT